MAVVCDLLTDCSGEEHHVPIPAYGKAVAEFPLQWAGSNFLKLDSWGKHRVEMPFVYGRAR